MRAIRLVIYRRVKVQDFSLFFVLLLLSKETKATKQHLKLDLGPTPVTRNIFLDSVDFAIT